MDTPQTPPPLRSLPTIELLRELWRTGSALVQKHIALARAELKADLQAQVSVAKQLVAAALLALFAINLLLVALVLALSRVMPGWLAALALGVLLLAVAGAIGLTAWRRRARAPLAVTRRKVKEDLEWAKEHLR